MLAFRNEPGPSRSARTHPAGGPAGAGDCRAPGGYRRAATSRHSSSPRASGSAGRVVTREDAVLCGRPWAEETFRRLDAATRLTWRAADGRACRGRCGDLRDRGPGTAHPQRRAHGAQLSAAALRHRHPGEPLRRRGRRHGLHGARHPQDHPRAAHARRSMPCGAAAGAITAWAFTTWCSSRKTTSPPRARSPPPLLPPAASAPGVKVEVEVESLQELEEALRAGPDLVLLDDFSLEDLAAAVARNRSRGRPVALEASGSVSLQTVRAIAATGVDFVSSGGLTKNVRAVDLSMRLDWPNVA